jgi:hypothetical protein
VFKLLQPYSNVSIVMQGPCNVTWGPIFSTGRKATQRNSPVVLVPDETFLSGLPDADVPPWQQLQVHH